MLNQNCVYNMKHEIWAIIIIHLYILNTYVLVPSNKYASYLYCLIKLYPIVDLLNLAVQLRQLRPQNAAFLIHFHQTWVHGSLQNDLDLCPHPENTSDHQDYYIFGTVGNNNDMKWCSPEN